MTRGKRGKASAPPLVYHCACGARWVETGEPGAPHVCSDRCLPITEAEYRRRFWRKFRAGAVRLDKEV